MLYRLFQIIYILLAKWQTKQSLTVFSLLLSWTKLCCCTLSYHFYCGTTSASWYSKQCFFLFCFVLKKRPLKKNSIQTAERLRFVSSRDHSADHDSPRIDFLSATLEYFWLVETSNWAAVSLNIAKPESYLQGQLVVLYPHTDHKLLLSYSYRHN